MLTGETPKEEQRRIEEELATKSTGHSFRFLFVTPEKIAKAKRFVSRLEKLYRNDALARVVIGARIPTQRVTYHKTYRIACFTSHIINKALTYT